MMKRLLFIGGWLLIVFGGGCTVLFGGNVIEAIMYLIENPGANNDKSKLSSVLLMYWVLGGLAPILTGIAGLFLASRLKTNVPLK